MRSTPNVGRRRAAAIGLMLAVGLATSLLRVFDQQPAAGLRPAPVTPAANGAPSFARGFVPNPDLRELHSASLVDLDADHARIFWISGNEGSSDAVVATAVFDRDRATWGPVGVAATPQQTARDVWRSVRKVGNAVAGRAPDGSLRLYYVSVSIGGWAGSTINQRTSNDDGQTWGPARRLAISPFMNLSTLVRNAPFAYADGSIGLPAYHEFLAKRSELLRLGSDGRVDDVQRIAGDRMAIQPAVLVRSPDRAIALMRNARDVKPRHVIQADTRDGAAQWSAARDNALLNPGSPVTGVALPDGGLLVVANDSQNDRRRIGLYASYDDGASWLPLGMLDDQSGRPDALNVRQRFTDAMREVAVAAGFGPADALRIARAATLYKCYDDGCNFEYSYPSLVRTPDGRYLLVYTWNRTLIAWIAFDQAWLDGRIAEARRARGD